jgi:hypothetical protein
MYQMRLIEQLVDIGVLVCAVLLCLGNRARFIIRLSETEA